MPGCDCGVRDAVVVGVDADKGGKFGAREFEVLSENVLDGKLMASAAVSGDVLFLRTDKALYSISNKTSSSP